MNRRDFIRTFGAATAALSVGEIAFAEQQNKLTFKSNRPRLEDRCFTSSAVEEKILEIKAKIADPELAWMFENCFPNTLDTTVNHYEKDGIPFTYVITGDIDAMWLRDSSAQVWPYIPLANKDEKLKRLIAGVINKQSEFILLDPYANAFFDDKTKVSDWKNDYTSMLPGVHERKWEIDSLCYFLRLSYGYWKTTGDRSPFGQKWRDAAIEVVKTFKDQQRKNDNGKYKFQRRTPVATDTQFGGGYGNPTSKNGLIHSMFRPSDDATFYPYLVSSNMFAVVTLSNLSEIISTLYNDSSFSKECLDLSNEVDLALKKFAILDHPYAGKIYPLEVDGFGNALFMDDANVPNLLSIPYLGYCSADNQLYKNTRKFSLSNYNPWFHKGKYAAGIGGPHVGENKIWPMGLIMQILTSTDVNEIETCLRTLKNTHAGTGFIHESFHVDDPSKYSRSWFAWANTLFGEMIIYLAENYPAILKRIL